MGDGQAFLWVWIRNGTVAVNLIPEFKAAVPGFCGITHLPAHVRLSGQGETFHRSGCSTEESGGPDPAGELHELTPRKLAGLLVIGHICSVARIIW
jgi:hypothetical protein